MVHSRVTRSAHFYSTRFSFYNFIFPIIVSTILYHSNWSMSSVMWALDPVSNFHSGLTYASAIITSEEFSVTWAEGIVGGTAGDTVLPPAFLPDVTFMPEVACLAPGKYRIRWMSRTGRDDCLSNHWTSECLSNHYQTCTSWIRGFDDQQQEQYYCCCQTLDQICTFQNILHFWNTSGPS